MIKRLVPRAVAPIIVGSLVLQRTLARPRLAELHNADILALLAVGMCFGVALAAIVANLRNR